MQCAYCVCWCVYCIPSYDRFIYQSNFGFYFIVFVFCRCTDVEYAINDQASRFRIEFPPLLSSFHSSFSRFYRRHYVKVLMQLPHHHRTNERTKKLNFNRFAVDFAVQLRLYRACIFLNHHRYLKPHCAQWVRNDSTRACVRFIFFGEFLCESKYLFGTSEKNPIFVPYNPHAVQHFHLHIRSTRENVLGFFFARTNLRCSAIAYENRFY